MCKYDSCLSKPNSLPQINYMILCTCIRLEMQRKWSGRQHCKLMALITCWEGEGPDREGKEGGGAFVSCFGFASHCLDFSGRCICVFSV